MTLKSLFTTLTFLFFLSACKSGENNSSSETSNTNSASDIVDSSMATPIFNPEPDIYLAGETIEVTAPFSNSNVLLTANGSEPSTSNYLFSSSNIKMIHSIYKTGYYMIKARTLYLNKVSNVITKEYTFIDNPNSIDNKVELLHKNYLYMPSTSAGDDAANYFEFKTTAGSSYIIDLCGLRNSSDKRKFSSSLFSNSDFTSPVIPYEIINSLGTNSYGEQIIFKSPTTAYYYLKVKENNGLSISSYFLYVYEPNGINSMAIDATPTETTNETIGQAINLFGCSRKFYKFTAKAGKKYDIFTSTDSISEGDTVLVLYNAELDGVKSINDNDDYFSGKCPKCSSIRDIFVTEDTELFFMIKQGESANYSGNYLDNYTVHLYQH